MTRIDSARVSALIPAYNEAERVGAVLGVVLSAKWIDKVLVIDDASQDETASVAAAAGAHVIRLEKNLGKGAALQAGIDAAPADTDIFLFLDADLLGLTKVHLRGLVRPLLYQDDVVMSVGRFAGGRLSTDISQFVLPILNGQRALRAGFVAELPDLRGYRFGVEVVLSKIAASRGMKVQEVSLRGLAQVMKEEKQGLLRGTVHRYRMYYDCLDAWRAYVAEERRKARVARHRRS